MSWKLSDKDYYTELRYLANITRNLQQKISIIEGPQFMKEI